MEKFLFKILKKSGEYALKKQKKALVQIKADMSVVTEADLFISEYLKRKIHKFAKKNNMNYCIVDEESDNSFSDYEKAEYAFIIDPIDGTMNFTNGHVLWGISIGIFKNKKPYAGGVFLPAINKMLFTDSKKLFINDKNGYKEIESFKNKKYYTKNMTFAISNGFMENNKLNLKYLASENATVSHMYFVNTRTHVASIQRAKIWDTAASLSIGNVNGIYPWDIGSHERIHIFDKYTLNKDFSHGDNFLFCAESYVDVVVDSIESIE